MQQHRTLDLLVRARLNQWPQRPPGFNSRWPARDAWLRGRPTGEHSPFLKLPGSTRLRTLPDGLWLNFGGTAEEPFVDIFAVEACGTLQNLLDKRSRFAPSTQSLVAVCPVFWLLGPVTPDDATPRWQATRLLREAPTRPFVLPVRDLRVLYGLKTRHYHGFATSQVPHAHEYFVPMDSLIAENGAQDPALQALLSHACASSNFLTTANCHGSC
jgi:hypothetical protein